VTGRRIAFALRATAIGQYERQGVANMARKRRPRTGRSQRLRLSKRPTRAEFEPLSSAESRLLTACAAGRPAEIADKCPKRKSAKNVVRAEFVRFLALGGDESTRLHEQGLGITVTPYLLHQFPEVDTKAP